MTKLAMPKIDRKLISKKVDVIADLKKIIKAENILYHEDETRPFETDALSAYKQKPMVVIFPENTEEVYLDITHAFRHFPIVAAFSLPVLKYLKNFKKEKTKNPSNRFYYGFRKNLCDNLKWIFNCMFCCFRKY